MNLSLFNKNKAGSRNKPQVYVSKLGSKRKSGENKNRVTRSVQGVKTGFVRRCITVISSDLNVICSIWKPRVVYVKEDPNELISE